MSQAAEILKSLNSGGDNSSSSKKGTSAQKKQQKKTSSQPSGINSFQQDKIQNAPGSQAEDILKELNQQPSSKMTPEYQVREGGEKMTLPQLQDYRKQMKQTQERLKSLYDYDPETKKYKGRSHVDPALRDELIKRGDVDKLEELEKAGEQGQTYKHTAVPNWYRSGLGSLEASVGGGMEFLGKKLQRESFTPEQQQGPSIGQDKGIGAQQQEEVTVEGPDNALTKWGRSLKKEGSQVAKESMMDPGYQKMQESVEDLGWEDAVDPNVWAWTAGQSLPFLQALAPAMMGGAYIGGAAGGAASSGLGLAEGGWGASLLTATSQGLGGTLASRPMESALEAGGTYKRAKEKGFDDEKANAAANEMFAKNLAFGGVMDTAELTAALTPLKIFKASKYVRPALTAGKVAGVSGIEAGEEITQEYLQSQALGEDFSFSDKDTKIAGLAGAGMGAIMGGGGEVATAGIDAAAQMNTIQNKVVKNLPKDLKKKVNDRVEKYTRQGDNKTTAKNKALNEIYQEEKNINRADKATQQAVNEMKLDQSPNIPTEQVGYTNYIPAYRWEGKVEDPAANVEKAQSLASTGVHYTFDEQTGKNLGKEAKPAYFRAQDLNILDLSNIPQEEISEHPIYQSFVANSRQPKGTNNFMRYLSDIGLDGIAMRTNDNKGTTLSLTRTAAKQNEISRDSYEAIKQDAGQKALPESERLALPEPKKPPQKPGKTATKVPSKPKVAKKKEAPTQKKAKEENDVFIPSETKGSKKNTVYVRDTETGERAKIDFVRSKQTGKTVVDRSTINEQGEETFSEQQSLEKLQEKYGTKSPKEIAKRFSLFKTEAADNAQIIASKGKTAQGRATKGEATKQRERTEPLKKDLKEIKKTEPSKKSPEKTEPSKKSPEKTEPSKKSPEKTQQVPEEIREEAKKRTVRDSDLRTVKEEDLELLNIDNEGDLNVLENINKDLYTTQLNRKQKAYKTISEVTPAARIPKFLQFIEESSKKYILDKGGEMLSKVTIPNRGLDINEFNKTPQLLYPTYDQGFVTDKYLAVLDKDVAQKTLDSLYRKENKNQEEVERLKKEFEGEAPAIEKIIPEQENIGENEAVIQGYTNIKGDLSRKALDQVTGVILSDGKNQIVVDGNKLAWLKKQLPDSSIHIQKNEKNMMVMQKDGKVTGLLMPIREMKENQFPDVNFKKERPDILDRSMIPGDQAAKVARELRARLKLDGLDVEVLDAILTDQDGETAFGVSYGSTVAFGQEVPEFTAFHEMGHAVFKNLDNIQHFKDKGITKEALWEELRNRYGEDKKKPDLEELLMEDFELYLQNKQELGKMDKVKQFFQDVVDSVKRIFGKDNRSIARRFFEEIEKGRPKKSTRIPSKGHVPIQYDSDRRIMDFKMLNQRKKEMNDSVGFMRETPMTSSDADNGGVAPKQVQNEERWQNMTQGMELPELYSLFQELTQAAEISINNEVVLKKQKKKLGAFYHYPGGEKSPYIALDPRIFDHKWLPSEYGPNAEQRFETDEEATSRVSKVFAHELFHLEDFLPEGTMSRGNVIGRLQKLNGFKKQVIGNEKLIDERQKIMRRVNELKKKEAQGQLTDKNRQELNEKEDRLQEINEQLTFTKDIQKELERLSFQVRPLPRNPSPKHLSYRKSAPELYADFGSTLLTNPALAKEQAPTFYDMFFDELAKRQEFADAFQELNGLVHGEKNRLIEKRIQDAKQIIKSQNELFTQKLTERGQNKVNLWQRFKHDFLYEHWYSYQMHDRNESFYEAHPDASPKYFMEEKNYIPSKIKGFFWKNGLFDIMTELEKAGLEWEDLDIMLFNERIAEGMSRVGVANPFGTTQKAAQETVNYIREESGKEGTMYSEEQAKTLVEQSSKLQRSIKKAILEYPDLFSDEMIDLAENTEKYIPFNKLDKAMNEIPAAMMPQEGTLNTIGSPGTAGMLKLIGIIKAGETNNLKKMMIDAIKRDEGPESFLYELQAEDYTIEQKQGKIRRVPEEPDTNKQPGIGLLTVVEKGKRTGYYVHEDIAKSFDNAKKTERLWIKYGIGLPNKLFKHFMISLSPSFQLVNFAFRDAGDVKKLPGMTIAEMLKRYKQTLPKAKRKAFEEWDSTVNEMLERGTLITMNSGYFRFTNDVDEVTQKGVESVMQMAGFTPLGEKGIVDKIPGASQVNKAFDWAMKVGEMLESTPKIVAYEYLKDTQALGDGRELEHWVKNTGSPNFIKFSRKHYELNQIFMFYNAIMRGHGRAYEKATAPKTRQSYWRHQATYAILPAVLGVAAEEGLFGKWMEKEMRYISEYMKNNYIPVPLGINPVNNKLLYASIPMSEDDRMIHAMTRIGLKSITDKEARIQEMASLLKYTAGQTPSLSPMIGISRDWGVYLAGGNPYDYFRGQHLFNRAEAKAGQDIKFPLMTKWSINQTGIWQFELRDSASTTSLGEKIVTKTPGIERLIRVGNYGVYEEAQKTKQKVQKEEASESVIINRKIMQAVKEFNEKQPENKKEFILSRIREAYNVAGRELEDRDLKREVEEFANLVRTPSNAPRLNTLQSGSNRQKAQLLDQYRQEMDRETFRGFLKKAMRLDYITENTLKDFADLYK